MVVKLEVSILVDFNSTRLDGTLGAAASLANGVPAPGDLVVLHDGEQNTCQAWVESVEGQLIKTRPLWETWVSGAAVSVTHQIPASPAFSVAV